MDDTASPILPRPNEGRTCMSSRNRIGVVAVDVVAEVPTEATHRKFGMHGKLGRAVGRLVKIGSIGCSRSGTKIGSIGCSRSGTICASPSSTTTCGRARERKSRRQ